MSPTVPPTSGSRLLYTDSRTELTWSPQLSSWYLLGTDHIEAPRLQTSTFAARAVAAGTYIPSRCPETVLIYPPVSRSSLINALHATMFIFNEPMTWKISKKHCPKENLLILELIRILEYLCMCVCVCVFIPKMRRNSRRYSRAKRWDCQLKVSDRHS
jgi:hypothetical protein